MVIGNKDIQMYVDKIMEATPKHIFNVVDIAFKLSDQDKTKETLEVIDFVSPYVTDDVADHLISIRKVLVHQLLLESILDLSIATRIGYVKYAIMGERIHAATPSFMLLTTHSK